MILYESQAELRKYPGNTPTSQETEINLEPSRSDSDF